MPTSMGNTNQNPLSILWIINTILNQISKKIKKKKKSPTHFDNSSLSNLIYITHIPLQLKQTHK